MINLQNLFNRFFNKYLIFILILFIPMLFFWKVFLQSSVPFPGDFITGIYYPWRDYSVSWGYPAGVPVKNALTADVPSFIYPMQTFAAKLLNTHQLPLWNPFILAGTPLLANFQSAPFSPTNIIYFLTDTITAWTIQIILQHVLAILFTYLFLREIKLSKVSSLFGGVIFAFSGFNLIWSQWNGHALTAAFIPLILYCESKFLKNKKIYWGLGISISICCQLLSGYPQVVLYTFVAMGLFWLSTLNKKLALPTLLLGFFVILGIALASVQISPGKELLSYSQRETEQLDYYLAFLPYSHAITFIAPDFFGNPGTGNYWGDQDYTTTTGFVGVVALTLAIVGLAKANNKKFVYLLLVSSLLLSFPTFVSLWLWKSGLLGLQAASAHRALVLFNLAVAILAAFGLENLPNIKFKSILRFLVPAATLLLVYVVYALSINQQVALRNLIFPSFIFVLLSGLFVFKKLKLTLYLTIFLCMLELFRFGWKFTPFSSRNMVFPVTPEIQFLMQQEKPFRITAEKVIPINLRMPYGVESMEGYDAVYPWWTAQFIASISSNLSDATAQGRYGHVDNPNSPMLDLANVKFFVTLKQNDNGDPDKDGKIPEMFNSSRFEKVLSGPTTVIYKNKKALPRAFMVYDWIIEPNDKKTLDLMLDPFFEIGKKLVLKQDPNIDKASVSSSEVNYIDYQAQSSVIKVNTPQSGLLFVSDTYYPGWKATVDGIDTPILEADYMFRAIAVPQGYHTVEMTYEPESFRNGLGITLVSVGIVIGLFMLAIIKSVRYTH